MDKLYKNVDLLEKIISDIKNEFKLSSSKNPDNMRLKEMRAKFNLCIRNEYLSGEDMMNKGERENDETMGFERENEDLDEEMEKDETTGFENKNDDFRNVHLSDDDLGNNDLGEEKQNDESAGFEKKNVDDYDKENENADDSTGKGEENENDDMVFEKKNDDSTCIEKENSDDDGCINVSKNFETGRGSPSKGNPKENFENEKKTESPSKEEVFETGHSSPSKDEILDTKEGSTFSMDKEKVDEIKVKYKFSRFLLKFIRILEYKHSILVFSLVKC